MPFGVMIVDEADLTRRVTARESRIAVAEFEDGRVDDDVHAVVFLRTASESEFEASERMDFYEAALVRLLGGGEDVRVELKILTHQRANTVDIKLSRRAEALALQSIGVFDGGDHRAFVMQRLVAESQAAEMRLAGSSIATADLKVEFYDGQRLRAQRAREFY